MIVGDDSDFCYLMQRYVCEGAYRLLKGYPYQQILRMVESEQPAAIILEGDLPGAQGWQILQSLKGGPRTASIPVILCSWADNQEQGLAAGADLYLRKPVLYEHFLSALRDLGVPSHK
jgi:CheY-like chemotaxis protein